MTQLHRHAGARRVEIAELAWTGWIYPLGLRAVVNLLRIFH